MPLIVPGGRRPARKSAASKAADSAVVDEAPSRRAELDPTFERQRQQTANTSPIQTLGRAGFESRAGYLSTPEADADLVGSQKYITYSSMLANCDIVALGVSFFCDLMAKVEWKYEPADDSSAAQEAADFVQNALDDMATPLRRVRRRAAMKRFYGFSIQEWTAKRRDDGKLGILDVESRPQATIERWDVDEFGVVVGVLQRVPTEHVERYLPRSRVLHFIDDAISDSPEGFGLFRSIVRAWKILARYEDVEGIGFVTDLRGIPLIYAPILEMRKMVEAKQLSQADYDAAFASIEAFMRGHIKAEDLALRLDSEVFRARDQAAAPSALRKWVVELVNGGASAFEPIGTAINRLQLQLARRLGIMQFMLGGTGGGAFALSEDQSKSFAATVDSENEEAMHTVSQDLVRPLLLLNGIDRKLAPKIKADKLFWRSVAEVAAAFRDMSVAGITLSGEDEAVGEFFDMIGFTRPDFGNRAIDATAEDLSLRPTRPAGTNGTSGARRPAPEN